MYNKNNKKKKKKSQRQFHQKEKQLDFFSCKVTEEISIYFLIDIFQIMIDIFKKKINSLLLEKAAF